MRVGIGLGWVWDKTGIGMELNWDEDLDRFGIKLGLWIGIDF